MKTDYFKIQDPELKDKIRKLYGEEKGTYSLHWFKDDGPREIGRLLGIDTDGVLYIGKTDTPLYNRVSSLRNSVLSNSAQIQSFPIEKGHKALSMKFFRIRKRIDIKDLYVKVFPAEANPLADESFLLEKYASKFGELPPLNGDYGSQEHWDLF